MLRRLRLSGKRLVFLAQTLADLGERRAVLVRRGVVAAELDGTPVAVTHAPVPGFVTRSAAVRPVVVHPWPWLYRPHAGPVTSFTAWRRRLPRRGGKPSTTPPQQGV